MTLRIGRGFFRLWVVLTFIWVSAVVGITWIDYDQLGLTDEELGIHTAPAFDPSKPYTVVPPGADLPDTPWALIERKRTKAIKYGVELALIPPALLLMLGLAFGWVIRGFQGVRTVDRAPRRLL